ncbi:LbtU family siderophore porin [Legionella sp. MW5194]|uniref:LbtU family siderophore porin n=1 Tax=Legionella sp. MW5194 TaxID=2662448 RepID=UPI00193CB242|nr:LbtU family siderophore porin [Legionella sp. MW5194]QRN03058.1 LbtU family siderophore porin [Legionella sp. MW5194]
MKKPALGGLFILSSSVAALPHPFENERFSYQGHVFFNVSDSAMAGERYLLNQQLSNVKLESDWAFREKSQIKGLLIYNTLPTPVTPELYFEQLYLGLHEPAMAWFYVDAGRKWLPFGNYKNDLIYKPLTKAMGQTNEDTLVMAFDNRVYGSVSLFSPHSRVRSSTLDYYYNLNTGWHNEYYDVGFSYLYSFAESQLFQYNKGFGGYLFSTINSHVPGGAAYVNWHYRGYSTYLTFVSALRRFDSNELAYQNQGAAPKALSVQSGYAFQVRTVPVKASVFYDQSFQALALQLPEKRAGVGLALFPKPYLTLQLQYFKDLNYKQSVMASGLERQVKGYRGNRDTFALQAIVNF